MKEKVQYQYTQIKQKLDEKWASPRGPENFQELKEMSRLYRAKTGERFYGYEAVVLVYDIGPNGARHSYKNAAKLINRTVIGEPKKWITDTMVHNQKYVGLCLLDIDIEYDANIRMKAQKVKDVWWAYQKIQEARAKAKFSRGEVPEEKIKAEQNWEKSILDDTQQHLRWLQTERSQVVPIVVHLEQDLPQWQGHLEKIQKLLEIETEELNLLRQLEDRQCKYWRNIIKALD